MKSYQPPGSTFGDVIKTIPAPANGAQGLAWDGSNLWVVWGDIYKVDPANGSVLAQIPGPAGDIQGLTWDGSTLWCVSYATDYIYQLNPSDGTVLNSFPSPGSQPIGIAWDGAYLWHSDENGILYKLDPSDGSVAGSVPAPHSSVHMLDWDGQYLWTSADRLYQFDTSSWQTLKSIRAPAAFLKGITWDGENLWSGGWEDDTLYLLDATPAGATVGGRVLKNGAPIASKEMYIVKNSNTSDEMQVGWITTDANGQYSFTVDPEVEYELRGFGDTGNNEFQEWVELTTPASGNPDVALPDVDIWYDGLLGPADGATFNRDQVSAGNPITFSWSAKTGATDYVVWLRQHDDWGYTLWNSPASANTAVNFDGTTNDGIHLGMGLDSGWWAWSEHRSLDITSTSLTITVDGNPGDWAAAVPIATDAAGDNTGGPAGTDIGSIYSYVDDTDVYFLVEVHDPNIVYTATIELNLDYKPGKHYTWGSTTDLHTNIWNGGINAWTGDMEPYAITGAQVAFGEAMEIRIPRDQLENTSYAIPTFVKIWVDGTGWDSSTIVP
jgi:glutamine cyclotransferase